MPVEAMDQPFVGAVSKIGEAVYLGDPDVVMGLLRDLLVDTIERWSSDDPLSDQEKRQRTFEDGRQVDHLVEVLLGQDPSDFMPMPAWNEPGFIDEWIASQIPAIEKQSPKETVETALRLFLNDAWSVVERWTKPGAEEDQVQNAITLVLNSWTEVFLGIDAAALAETDGEVFDPAEMSDDELVAMADAADSTSLHQADYQSDSPVLPVEKSFRSVIKSLGELFDESEHPRGEGGEFAKKGTGKAGKKSKVSDVPSVAAKDATITAQNAASMESASIPHVDRQSFVDGVANAPAGKMKLDRLAVKEFHATGDVEAFIAALDEKGGKDNYVGSIRAAAAFADKYGGIDIVKSPTLRAVREKSIAVGNEIGEEKVAAIRQYTTDDYGPLNEALRKGGKLPANGKEMVSAVSDAVDRVGDWPEPAMVFRGIGCQDETEKATFIKSIESHLKSGKAWTDKGIVSTSASEKMSRDWVANSEGGGILMRIKAKSGILVSQFTGLSGQQEIIQKPGTKYKPTKITHDGNLAIVDFEQV